MQVVDWEELQRRTHWRRTVQVRDESETALVTFWNSYATRDFHKGETLLVVGAEMSSRPVSPTATERQINVWYNAMVLECDADYAEFALHL